MISKINNCTANANYLSLRILQLTGPSTSYVELSLGKRYPRGKSTTNTVLSTPSVGYGYTTEPWTTTTFR